MAATPARPVAYWGLVGNKGIQYIEIMCGIVRIKLRDSIWFIQGFYSLIPYNRRERFGDVCLTQDYRRRLTMLEPNCCPWL